MDFRGEAFQAWLALWRLKAALICPGLWLLGLLHRKRCQQCKARDACSSLNLASVKPNYTWWSRSLQLGPPGRKSHPGYISWQQVDLSPWTFCNHAKKPAGVTCRRARDNILALGRHLLVSPRWLRGRACAVRCARVPACPRAWPRLRRAVDTWQTHWITLRVWIAVYLLKWRFYLHFTKRQRW